MPTCKGPGCAAELQWVPSRITGSRIPLTPVTRERLAALTKRARRHVYRLDGDACVPAEDLERLPAEVPLYLNHFVDCPERGRFRRPRGA